MLPYKLNFRNLFTLSSRTTWNVRAELLPTLSKPLSPDLEIENQISLHFSLVFCGGIEMIR